MITIFIFSACMLWVFVAIVLTGVQLLEWISAWQKRREMLLTYVARWEADGRSHVSMEEAIALGLFDEKWEPANKVNWRKEGF